MENNENISYQITSIYDMFESVPLESVDNFLVDLKNIFIFKKRFEIKINQFTWIDDKKHDLNLSLKVDDTEIDKASIKVTFNEQNNDLKVNFGNKI
jgi:hypothetical protein